MIEYSNESTDEDTGDTQTNIETIETDDISYDSEEIKLGDEELEVNKKNKQSKQTQHQLEIRRAIEDRLEQRRLREQLDYLGNELTADINSLLPMRTSKDANTSKPVKVASSNKVVAKQTDKPEADNKKTDNVVAKPKTKTKMPVAAKPNVTAKSKAKPVKPKTKQSSVKK